MEAQIICFLAGLLFMVVNTILLCVFQGWRRNRSCSFPMTFLLGLVIATVVCGIFHGMKSIALEIFGVEGIDSFFWYGMGAGIVVVIGMALLGIWYKPGKKFETIE